MTENSIIDQILSIHPFMFRNAVGYGIACAPKHAMPNGKGGFYVRRGSPVRFGLMKGSSDMIGWETIEITQEMVGQKVAVFASREIKTQKDKLSDEQRTWNRNVLSSGGICEVWHEKSGTIEVLKGDDII
jgi:hypothetical protein